MIACIALFVALGGVSYGLATGSIDSREIRDNTIRSKDVRNNSIYTRDLRNNDIRAIDIRNGEVKGRDVGRGALTGDNINMAKLGQVPDAAALAGVPATGYVRAAEPVQAAPGATALGGADLAPGFWKEGMAVHLEGTVNGTADLFTLPEGYRPAGRVRFRVPSALPAAETTVTITAAGVVTTADPDPALDGISFRGP